MPTSLRAIALLLLVLPSGCSRVLNHGERHSPLLPVSASSEALTLEIFSAPAAVDDRRLVELWADVDEQALPAELRERLAANGIRAGIAGPRMPAPLAELLKLTDREISKDARTAVALDIEPSPQLNVVQPRAGQRRDLVVSHVYEEMALLRTTSGHTSGNTYRQAECRFDLRVLPQPDGRVRLTLAPELHYGEMRNRVAGDSNEGHLYFKPERSQQIFSDLTLVASLTAGQMLIVTSDGTKPGSIGHHFFTAPGLEKPLQKVWVLRLAQAGSDPAFLAAAAETELAASP